MAETERLLESALEMLPDPWIVWRAEGRVAAASSRLSDALGVAADEVLGATEAVFNEAIARHKTFPAVGAPAPTFRNAGGHEFRRISHLLQGGGRVDLFHDVTEDRAAAQRREALLGVAIHELRAPLANVRSYAGLLLSGRMPGLDPRVHRSAEVIARNADKSLRLLQMYFDAQRAGTGELDIDRQPVELGNLLQEALAARRAAAAEKGVELSAAVPAVLPSVLGDHDRLLNAVGALVDNAIARSPPNGRVEVLFNERPREAWIGVAEAGEPLTPQDIRDAFDLDAQALKERRLGPGFAVAVARAIAHTHGGTAGVSSAPGRTVFSLTLPR